jgi:hypothetical protein
MAYCAEHETDGELSRAIVDSLTAHRNKDRLIAELVAANVWEQGVGSLLIHDYLDWNPSHAEQRAKRDAACKRMNTVRSPSVRANKERTSQEPVSTPSRPDPQENTHSRAIPPTTYQGLPFEALFCEITKRPTGAAEYTREASRLCMATATQESADPVATTREILDAYLRLLARWREKGIEGGASVPKFIEHYAKILDERQGASPAIPVRVGNVPGIEETRILLAKRRAERIEGA